MSWGEGQVISVHTDAEWKAQKEKLDASGLLGVVDFTASWCPPCRFIAPVFAEFAKKYPHVVFLKVDVDELQSVAKEFSVDAMPTFLFFKNGEVVDKILGADKEGILRFIGKHAGEPAVATA